MDYKILRDLIDHFEAFEKEKEQSDMASFATWLHEKYFGDKSSAAQLMEPDPIFGGYDGQLAYAVGTLYQHAKHYIKSALAGTPLVSLHDFTFLAALHGMGDLRKTELVRLNTIELSPGMEVIKRLLRKDLIEDYKDPEDGRSKRVRITEKGEKVFYQCMDTMSKASRIIGGNLGDKEKAITLLHLYELIKFHAPIWENDHGQELETIIEKYDI